MNIKFNCQHCGKCCTNLINRDSHGDIGLMILPHEKDLFDKSTIRPCMGFDNYLYSGFNPSYIESYQLSVNTCPHLTSDHRCEIYDKRPTVCRTFPLVIQYPKSKFPAIESRCTYISRIPKLGSDSSGVFKGEETHYYEMLLKPLVDAFNRYSSISFYNLRTNSWGPKIPIIDKMRSRYVR